ncbi:MAG: hypothetical protein DRP93_08600 [Candidatus Neomarinimicrobiota bacterium]|nr:MAG: hypothetical protein DRP93_08600 [Candidatus Neomarinimicrobiota bacterium]
MRVSELFVSIQGEGPFVGTPAAFVRLSGCNLTSLPCGPCPFCDTKYSLARGDEKSVDEVVEFIHRAHVNLVVVTGGEPLLQQSEVGKLLDALPNHVFNIETNGTIRLSLPIRSRVLYSISPKVHAREFLALRSFAFHQHVLKFVYERNDEILAPFIESCRIMTGLPRQAVWVMPCCRHRDEFVEVGVACAEFCIKHGYRFGPREHIVLWDGERAR